MSDLNADLQALEECGVMSDDLFQEASEIVTAIATMDPITHDAEWGDNWCTFCNAEHDVPIEGQIVMVDHEPDCVWIRARRLCRLEIHPHKVAS